MLTIPLVTLLGLAAHPGDAHGLGAIDPALARQMAASAARNPRSTWCVTVTDEHGTPSGTAAPDQPRPGGNPAGPVPPAPATDRSSPLPPPMTADPRRRRVRDMAAAINGRDYKVTLIPIPVADCDHRYETAGYRPGALLRHLVEVRDGQCTQPTCVRAARRCDFEHAVPYD